MIIRRERPADHDAVRALHEAAFGRDVEARLLDELREDVGFLPHLSLVAVDDDVVGGHVIGTRGWLEPLGVPALVVDADGRGLHDRLTDTAVIREK